ncbi:YjgN family protein [Marinobacterium aestuariivivens]|uniref:YjgN family protein n=1 Tax=Marinobacterium aestuariivivens TaxID=1698799 RepID=A0ABW1ZYR0_9GAMM
MNCSAPAASGSLRAAPRRLPFEFSGDTREYFRIWIINLCLTVLTLGLYSPWAKVRKMRYFYGHTALDGSSFEYTADPVTLLKGRLIAVAALALYALCTTYLPLIAPLFGLAFIVAMPWLIVRSLRFGHYHSRYRGIRFDFDGQYRNAAIWYLLGPLASVLTLGLAIPYFACRQQQWLVRNSRFGTSRFDSDLRVGSVYGVYIIGLGIGLLGFLIPALLGTASVLQPGTGSLLAPLFGLPFFYLAGVFVRTRITNLTLNHACLDEHRFESRMETPAMCWLLVTNTLAILCSFGLLIPWTQIRMARYRADCTEVCRPSSQITSSRLRKHSSMPWVKSSARPWISKSASDADRGLYL